MITKHEKYQRNQIKQSKHGFDLSKSSCIHMENALGPFGLNLLSLKLKTENQKHCSKIIFKCVNNTVGPIFNIF